MKTMNPYLNFETGKAREALEFYRECFRGEILSVMTAEDAPMDIPESQKKNILYAEFKAEGVFFMAMDNRPGTGWKPGDNAFLCVSFTDGGEQDAVWKALVEGGKVSLPMHHAFWGDRFGVLTDRYGVNWMLTWTPT